MPKTAIYQAAGSGGVQEYRVEVGWQRGTGVQVGASKLTPPAAPTVEWDNQPASTVSVTATAMTPPAWSGWHADLDRAQVNHLIRTLKKARDEAFGRDE